MASSASYSQSADGPDGAQGELVFAINGQRIVLPAASVDPAMTLNDYIRLHTKFTGTKISCGEGGCGACAVSLARYDAAVGDVVYVSANSCLRPLAAMHGWAVTTVEGIGSSLSVTGFNDVQERIAGFNGSQCGYCTPGMVMTMYSALKAREAECPEDPHLTQAEVEQQFDGQICRCTGYRPILDGFRSFAKDADIEDMVTGEQKCGGHDSSNDPKFPAFLRNAKAGSARFLGTNGRVWIRPTTLKEAFAALTKHGDKARVVVANTSVGIYKDDPTTVLVDIQNIPELRGVKVNSGDIYFGAVESLRVMAKTLERIEGEESAKGGDAAARVKAFSALVKHIRRIAGVHVRAVGSLGGNLNMARKHGFLSDLATILVAVGARAALISESKGREIVTVEEFLARTTLPADTLLQGVFVPFNAQGDAFHFNTYKTAMRNRMAHAYVNAGFAFEVDEKAQEIKSAVCAFAGVSDHDKAGAHAVRASATEEFLAGKPLNDTTLKAAIEILSKELVPSGEHRARFRHRLVTGFFYKFMVSLFRSVGTKVSDAVASAAIDYERPLQKSRQEFGFPRTHAPVSLPIPKLSAKVQASGEARYSGDVPLRYGTLHAAYVLSTVASGTIESVDTSAALKAPGVVDIIGEEDIPGVNSCAMQGPPIPILNSVNIKHHSQPIMLVVADTARHAAEAAQLVRVTYKDVKTPVITNEDAIKANKVMPSAAHHSIGDAASVLASTDDKHRVTGDVEMSTQFHFYMETQVSYAIPDEDGSMELHTATQWMDSINKSVAQCLGVPMNKVRAVNRRCGGGFGGKLYHATSHAAAAAVAAHKLQRPVRIVLSRNDDMRMHAGREETTAHYEAAFDDEGRITALTMQGFVGAGYNVDMSAFANMSFAAALSQVYNLKAADIKSSLVATNLASRTATRGPGEIQASYVIETIIEHIAHKSGLSPDQVREVNFYDVNDKDSWTVPNGKKMSHYTVPRLWALAKEKAGFDKLVKSVEEFNKTHRWRKRGLSVTPVRYEVSVWPRAALVNIYADGTILITHGAVEMGQGVNTKVAAVAAHELGLAIDQPLDINLVRFNDMNTSINPNQLFTGGSTGSEGACQAVRMACQQLVERLKSVVAAQREMNAQKADEAKSEGDGGDDDLSWQQVVGLALMQSVNLSAQAHWAGAGADSLTYMNFGACVSEVEIDVLTGEHEILLSEIVYDCGKSLNPAIDIGQCEGAFVMGVGFYLHEVAWYDKDARLVSDGTWEYKPPLANNIPQQFNVTLLQDAEFERGILSSKASGEPPLVLSTSVIMAVRQAIKAARKDAGVEDEFFKMPTPVTVDDIQRLCGHSDDQLTV